MDQVQFAGPPAQWVSRPDSFDLSPALPRSRLLHRDGATLRPVQWYFDNLLPEEKLRELSQACTDTLTTPVALFRWLVFNLLVGNDDCHLKNLSFLITPGRVDLAPHDDLLATGAYHTRAFADDQARWPAVPLAIRLSAEVTRFDHVTPDAVLSAAAELGVAQSLARRAAREVVTRVLVAFDALYAQHEPQQEGLMARLKGKAFEAAPYGAFNERTTSALEGLSQTQGAAERAQQIKLLRVMRHIVLPEMIPRVMG